MDLPHLLRLGQVGAWSSLWGGSRVYPRACGPEWLHCTKYLDCTLEKERDVPLHARVRTHTQLLWRKD